jgi:ribosomal protein L32
MIRMKIRQGRQRSLIGGILFLVVCIGGVVMMSRSGMSHMVWPFMVLWIIIGLVGAGAEFYNAFSRQGLTLYEVDMDAEAEATHFCPQCGEPIEENARFCKYCGTPLGRE